MASILFLMSFISYSCVALVSILFGLIYLFKNQFMPYHAEALSLSWLELEQKLQVLIIALMRASGGFLATGLAISVLLIFPFRAGDTWAFYTIRAIGLCTSLGALYASLLVRTKTPGTPPVVITFLSLGLTIIGFIFSIV